MRCVHHLGRHKIFRHTTILKRHIPFFGMCLFHRYIATTHDLPDNSYLGLIGQKVCVKTLMTLVNI